MKIDEWLGSRLLLVQGASERSYSVEREQSGERPELSAQSFCSFVRCLTARQHRIGQTALKSTRRGVKSVPVIVNLNFDLLANQSIFTRVTRVLTFAVSVSVLANLGQSR